MDNNYLLKTSFEERVKNALNDKVKLKKFTEYIENYFDRNGAIIFDNSPSKRLAFTVLDKNIIFDLTDISPEEVEMVIRKIPTIQSHWKTLNDPFLILLSLIVRQLHLMNLKHQEELALMFLAFKFYSNRQYRSFPYEPNKQIMDYTVNNLSNKFKYKQLQNNYNVVKDTAMVSHTTYISQLIEYRDYEVLSTWLTQLKDRIGKLINTIAEEFYENLKNKNYLNSSDMKDENGDTVERVNTISSDIQNDATNVSHQFVAYKVNIGLANVSAQKNSISTATLIQTINEIRFNENVQTIKALYSHIFNLLIDTKGTDSFSKVCSKTFANEILKIISISNSINKDLIAIKEIFERLLNDHCGKYAETNRLATKMAYRNALFSYFVFYFLLYKCK